MGHSHRDSATVMPCRTEVPIAPPTDGATNRLAQFTDVACGRKLGLISGRLSIQTDRACCLLAQRHIQSSAKNVCDGSLRHRADEGLPRRLGGVQGASSASTADRRRAWPQIARLRTRPTLR